MIWFYENPWKNKILVCETSLWPRLNIHRSVGRWVCWLVFHNFLKGRVVSLQCPYKSTCLWIHSPPNTLPSFIGWNILQETQGAQWVVWVCVYNYTKIPMTFVIFHVAVSKQVLGAPKLPFALKKNAHFPITAYGIFK